MKTLITTNDRFMCTVLCCENSISSYRLPYYIYILQASKLKFDFYFNFRVTYNGIRSKEFDIYINDLLSDSQLIDGKGQLSPSEDALNIVSSYLIDYESDELISVIISFLDDLNDSELKFLVFTSIVIKEIDNKYGINGLSKMQDYIQRMIEQHSGYFSVADFNSAIAFLRSIGGGKLL